jgi:hypothetical protein
MAAIIPPNNREPKPRDPSAVDFVKALRTAVLVDDMYAKSVLLMKLVRSCDDDPHFFTSVMAELLREKFRHFARLIRREAASDPSLADHASEVLSGIAKLLGNDKS